MKITIEGIQPDGLNVNIEGMIFDTVEECCEFIKRVETIYGEEVVRERRKMMENAKKIKIKVK